jgi:hypothetical protein
MGAAGAGYSVGTTRIGLVLGSSALVPPRRGRGPGPAAMAPAARGLYPRHRPRHRAHRVTASVSDERGYPLGACRRYSNDTSGGSREDDGSAPTVVDTGDG